MLQQLGPPIGRPRRGAAGDPRGDQHARGRPRRPDPRRVHRGPLAGPPAGPPGPRDRRDDPRGHPRPGPPLLPASTTCPGNVVVAAAGNLGTTESSTAPEPAWTRAGASCAGDAQAPDLRTSRDRAPSRRPGRSCAGARPSRRTSASARTASRARSATGSRSASPTPRSAAGCPRACSRRSARSAGWSTRCTATTRMYTESGLFSVYAGTTPARAQEVLGLIRRELEDVADGGSAGRGARAGQGSHEGLDGALAGGPGEPHVAARQVRDRPRRDPDARQALKRVEDVTLGDARRVAKRVLAQPMALAVIGPFAKRDLDGVMA